MQMQSTLQGEAVAGSCIRVLHIVDRMDRAGAETLIMNLYREIDRERIQFDFYCTSTAVGDYEEEIQKLGGVIYRSNGANLISKSLSLWKFLLNSQWEIVHAHTMYSSGFYLTAAQLAGVTHRIAHSHSAGDDRSGSVLGRAYQTIARTLLSFTATKRLACGDAAADNLFRDSSSRVTIIPNAIDIDSFFEASGVSVRESMGVNCNTLLILQVGRLESVKNHFFSIKMAAALKKAGVDYKMLFVGNGTLEKEISDSLQENELEEQVLLLGLRKDIPELMAASDVFLMPSIHEGFPVVLVEAQAAGLPAVISTSISNEVDLSLNLVNFVDLKKSAGFWANKLRAAAYQTLPLSDERFVALNELGYSSRIGAQKISGIYQSL